VFRIDDCFAPVDEIEQPWHRARALRAGLPDRLIAEQRSAAWIWGALTAPPTHHQLCAAMGARVRPQGVSWMTVREVVIEEPDILTVDGLQVTTMLRTAIDIARFSERFDQAERDIVRWLMRHGGFGLDECVADMNRRRNLPSKRRAAVRLASCA
jgi:hypothetical protein